MTCSASIEAPDLDSSWPRPGPRSRERQGQLRHRLAHRGATARSCRSRHIPAECGSVSRRRAGEEGDHGCRQAYVRQLEAMESFKQIEAPSTASSPSANTDIGALINSAVRAGRCSCFRPAPGPHLRPGPAGIHGRPPPGPESDRSRCLSIRARSSTRPLVTLSNAMIQATRSMQVELQADNSDASCTAARIAGSTSRSRAIRTWFGCRQQR